MKLLTPNSDKLSRYCIAIARNREDARDLMSETVLKAYQSFERVSKPDSFVYYLFSIARRINFRQQWKKRIFGNWDEKLFENIQQHETTPETNVDIQILYNTLAKLPAKQSEAVVLFEISGFSIEEIAKIQGSTQSAVKSRLKRGREKLSELISEKEKQFVQPQVCFQEIESIILGTGKYV